jgi:hypothetical protein
MSPVIVRLLQALIGLNQEAMRLHELCATRLGAEVPCEACQSHHVAHIGDLQRFLRNRGEALPPRGGDGPTDPGRALDAAGALDALLHVERRTNLAYDEVLQMSLDPETEALILAHFRDERRHLRILRQAFEAQRQQRRHVAA